jgi:hypothetical protein
MSLIKNLATIDRSLTKKGITEAAQNDAQQVIASPQFDLLKVYVELKRYENYLSEVIEQLKPLALESAQQKDEKTMTYETAKVRLQNRVTYDFSEDDKWKYLKESVTASQSSIKQHEEFLKNITEVKEVVDEATGEVYQVFPPQRKESQLLIVSF